MYTSIVSLLLLVVFTTPIRAEAAYPSEGNRLLPISTKINTPKTLNATFRSVEPRKAQPREEYARGSCPQVQVALTDSDFGVGKYILQAGFAEGEILAASYDVPTEDFPIRIDLAQVLFATYNTNVQTTTHWSIYVWDGTPSNGQLVATFSSDNIILPHLVMPPGTTGMIISVSVDPEDPEQIYIYNDSGQNKFTIGFGIDQHNNPGSPCISAPPTNSNAFPTTDTSGLQFPQENWINAVDGTFCVCGSGWFTFQQFPSLCTPSGDWVLRASYTSINCTVEPAACCIDATTCVDLSPSDCEALGGVIQNPGSACATFTCGQGDGACCIKVTGACVDFDVSTCLTVGGIHMGEGTLCSDITCFPEGACCLNNGNCIGSVSPEDCLAVGGAFQGDSTTCAGSNCPQPIGACCGGDWCLDLIEDDCDAVAGDWSGMNTTCTDDNICTPTCPEDVTGDGVVNVSDLLAIVGGWGSDDPALDIDGNGSVDTPDLLAVIAAWGDCE